MEPSSVFLGGELISCLGIGNWSPALQIRTILLSIQALLGAPNPDDPLANDVAQRWKEDEKAAIETGNFYHLFGLEYEECLY